MSDMMNGNSFYCETEPLEVNSQQPNEFLLDFVNQDHIKDLAKALARDPNSGSETGAEYLSTSSRRKMKKEDTGTPRGISYSISRYPLIVRNSIITAIRSLIFLFIVCYRHNHHIWIDFIHLLAAVGTSMGKPVQLVKIYAFTITPARFVNDFYLSGEANEDNYVQIFEQQTPTKNGAQQLMH